jgi:hypothetical protein
VCVFFITDGYHTINGKITDKAVTNEIISKFSQNCSRDLYYGIGLGTVNDHDSELLSSLFTNFTGCPTGTDILNAITGYAFSASSVIITNVKIQFSREINHCYEIKTSLKKSNCNDLTDNLTYELDKFDISTMIPFALIPKDNVGQNVSMPLLIQLSGLLHDGQHISFEYDINENMHINSENDVFIVKYYEFQDKYINTMSNDVISQSKCKIELEQLLIELNSSIPHKSHITYPLYQDLVSNISASMQNIQSYHISQLSKDDFSAFLRLGSALVQHQMSNYTSNTAARSNSIAITTQYSTIAPIIPDEIFPQASVAEDTGVINCKVCLAEPVTMMYLPCKHSCVCKGCAPHVNVCPICRGNIRGIKELSVNDSCMKCHTNIPNVMYYPCSHVIVCNVCVKQKKSQICEQCLSQFTKTIKMFI